MRKVRRRIKKDNENTQPGNQIYFEQIFWIVRVNKIGFNESDNSQRILSTIRILEVFK